MNRCLASLALRLFFSPARTGRGDRPRTQVRCAGRGPRFAARRKATDPGLLSAIGRADTEFHSPCMGRSRASPPSSTYAVWMTAPGRLAARISLPSIEPSACLPRRSSRRSGELSRFVVAMRSARKLVGRPTKCPVET